MDIIFPEKKKPKRVYTHVYGLSYFRVEQARACRKCTECRESIEKGQKCLKFSLFDLCGPHRRRSDSKEFFVHLKKQLCKKCANNRFLINHYFENYNANDSECKNVRRRVSLETALVEINAK